MSWFFQPTPTAAAALLAAAGSSKTLAFAIAQTHAMTDSIVRNRSAAVTIAEVEALAQAVIRSRRVLASIVETVAHTIALDKTTGGVSKTVAFSIAEVEAHVVAVARNRRVTLTSAEVEALTFATIGRARAMLVSVAETLAVTASTRRGRAMALTIVETEAIGASLGLLHSITLSLAETFGYSISVRRQRAMTAAVAEVQTHATVLRRSRQVAATLAEVIAYVIDLSKAGPGGGPKAFTFTIAQVEALTEALSRARRLQQTISETSAQSTAVRRTRAASLAIAELETIQVTLRKLKLMAFVSAETNNNAFFVNRARSVVWQSTNIIARSEEVGTAPWENGSTTVFGDDVLANPIDGRVNADKLRENSTTSNTHFTRQFVTTVPGQTYTFSAYVRAAERFEVRLYSSPAKGFGPTQVFQRFNVSTGELMDQVGVPAGNGGVINVGNGWFRVWWSAIATAAISTDFMINTSSAGSSAYAGIVGNGLHVWGVQLETGRGLTDGPGPYAASGAVGADREYESVVASFNRARAIVSPINETQAVVANFGRLRRQALSIAETQGLSAAMRRVRAMLQSVANTTGYTFNLGVYKGDPAGLRITVQWDEWTVIGDAIRLTPRTETLTFTSKFASEALTVVDVFESVIVVPDGAL